MINKIAVPSIGEMINEHFGRTQTFEVYEISNEGYRLEKVLSSRGLAHQHEGIAMMLREHGIETVICGGIGAGAITGLQKSGINVLFGAGGKIVDAIKAYIDGRLVSTGEICEHKEEQNTYRKIECLCEE